MAFPPTNGRCHTFFERDQISDNQQLEYNLADLMMPNYTTTLRTGRSTQARSTPSLPTVNSSQISAKGSSTGNEAADTGNGGRHENINQNKMQHQQMHQAHQQQHTQQSQQQMHSQQQQSQHQHQHQMHQSQNQVHQQQMQQSQQHMQQQMNFAQQQHSHYPQYGPPRSLSPQARGSHPLSHLGLAGHHSYNPMMRQGNNSPLGMMPRSPMMGAMSPMMNSTSSFMHSSMVSPAASSRPSIMNQSSGLDQTKNQIMSHLQNQTSLSNTAETLSGRPFTEMTQEEQLREIEYLQKAVQEMASGVMTRQQGETEPSQQSMSLQHQSLQQSMPSQHQSIQQSVPAQHQSMSNQMLAPHQTRPSQHGPSYPFSQQSFHPSHSLGQPRNQSPQPFYRGMSPQPNPYSQLRPNPLQQAAAAAAANAVGQSSLTSYPPSPDQNRLPVAYPSPLTSYTPFVPQSVPPEPSPQNRLRSLSPMGRSNSRFGLLGLSPSLSSSAPGTRALNASASLGNFASSYSPFGSPLPSSVLPANPTSPSERSHTLSTPAPPAATSPLSQGVTPMQKHYLQDLQRKLQFLYHKEQKDISEDRGLQIQPEHLDTTKLTNSRSLDDTVQAIPLGTQAWLDQNHHPNHSVDNNHGPQSVDAVHPQEVRAHSDYNNNRSIISARDDGDLRESQIPRSYEATEASDIIRSDTDNSYPGSQSSSWVTPYRTHVNVRTIPPQTSQQGFIQHRTVPDTRTTSIHPGTADVTTPHVPVPVKAQKSSSSQGSLNPASSISSVRAEQFARLARGDRAIDVLTAPTERNVSKDACGENPFHLPDSAYWSRQSSQSQETPAPVRLEDIMPHHRHPTEASLQKGRNAEPRQRTTPVTSPVETLIAESRPDFVVGNNKKAYGGDLRLPHPPTRDEMLNDAATYLDNLQKQVHSAEDTEDDSASIVATKIAMRTDLAVASSELRREAAQTRKKRGDRPFGSSFTHRNHDFSSTQPTTASSASSSVAAPPNFVHSSTFEEESTTSLDREEPIMVPAVRDLRTGLIKTPRGGVYSMNLVHIDGENDLKNDLVEKASHNIENSRVQEETSSLEAAHKELLTATGKIKKVQKATPKTKSPIPAPVTLSKQIPRKIKQSPPVDIVEPSSPSIAKHVARKIKNSDAGEPASPGISPLNKPRTMAERSIDPIRPLLRRKGSRIIPSGPGITTSPPVQKQREPPHTQSTAASRTRGIQHKNENLIEFHDTPPEKKDRSETRRDDKKMYLAHSQRAQSPIETPAQLATAAVKHDRSHVNFQSPTGQSIRPGRNVNSPIPIRRRSPMPRTRSPAPPVRSMGLHRK